MRGVFGKIKKTAVAFFKDESGQTTTEYILLIVVVLLIVRTLKGTLLQRLTGLMNGAFDKAQGELQDF